MTTQSRKKASEIKLFLNLSLKKTTIEYFNITAKNAQSTD